MRPRHTGRQAITPRNHRGHAPLPFPFCVFSIGRGDWARSSDRWRTAFRMHVFGGVIFRLSLCVSRDGLEIEMAFSGAAGGGGQGTGFQA